MSLMALTLQYNWPTRNQRPAWPSGSCLVLSMDLAMLSIQQRHHVLSPPGPVRHASWRKTNSIGLRSNRGARTLSNSTLKRNTSPAL